MSTLKIAIQKSGRLKDESLKILEEAGIKVSNGRDQLKVASSSFPLEIYFLRNADIPQYLEDGVVDVAILGQNTMAEKAKQVKELLPLGFSKCTLSLAVPRESSFVNFVDLQGKRIATSYPVTLRKFLDQAGLNCEIHEISGSVEIAPNIGLASAICDLVSSGSTLFKNGLREVYTVLKSEACLASNLNLSEKAEAILSKLVFRLEAVLRARKSKYILMNVPNSAIQKISDILPVLKSPTVLPLGKEGWSSLHSVIQETAFWELIDELKQAGAEDLLIIPIEKMVL